MTWVLLVPGRGCGCGVRAGGAAAALQLGLAGQEFKLKVEGLRHYDFCG